MHYKKHLRVFVSLFQNSLHLDFSIEKLLVAQMIQHLNLLQDFLHHGIAHLCRIFNPAILHFSSALNSFVFLFPNRNKYFGTGVRL